MLIGNEFDLRDLAAGAGRLARHGVMLGTSSWKYPGWCGSFYDEQRYLSRGRFSEARFKRECLAEYASILPTVGVDASYYTPPDPKRTSELFKTALDVNPDFQFGFKVTEIFTLRHFPNLPRHGSHRGTTNPNFLNAALFGDLFLGPLEPWRDHVGPLMFEFSAFHRRDFDRGRDFVDALDGFLEQLPPGWNYAVEIRNPSLLQPEYFQVLEKHDVAHVNTSWQKMPPLDEQLAKSTAIAQPFGCARLLLKPGRRYQQAVDTFSPYQSVQEPQPKIRETMSDWIRQLLASPAADPSSAPKSRRRAWLFVNNRLEGHAPGTLAAIINRIGPRN